MMELLQSRLYPKTDDEEIRDMYRSIVQRALADCLGVPNCWNLKREQEEVNRRVCTHTDALHYCDYEYKSFRANVSLLKQADIQEDDSILIGHTAYCLECSDPLHENSTLYYDACDDDDTVCCYNCDRQIHEDDAHEIGGRYYCNNCCSFCEHCNDYTTDDITEVNTNHGDLFYVCQNCLERYYYYCIDCGAYFEKSNGAFLDDGFRCSECLEENYCIYESCGQYVHNDDLESMEDSCYCSDCIDVIQYEKEEKQILIEYPESA